MKKIVRDYYESEFPVLLQNNICLANIRMISAHFFENMISTNLNTIYLIFRVGKEYSYEYIRVVLLSNEDDVITGDSLNGILFEVYKSNMSNDDLSQMFICSFSDLEFQIQCIEFWGEEDETIFDDKEGLAFWYRMSDNIPDAVHIKRKTMEMMAIQFKTGRWILISPRSGGFNIDIDKSTTPEKVFSDKFAKNSLPKIKMIKSIGERIC